MESTMAHSDNLILSRASLGDLEGLRPHLRLIEMDHGNVLAESRRRMGHVYFPHSGVISCVVEMENGAAIESGMIGYDGVFGAIQALDGKLSLHKAMVQVPGRAMVVEADKLKAVAH